jgi:hypothetical protein
MIDDGMVPCERCGVPRVARVGSNRSGFCRDCKAGHDNRDHAYRGWMDDAACTQVDPELFFPTEEDLWRPTRDAKKICASCPVRDLCLADTPAWDRWSIRGGITARERLRKAVA